MFVARIDDKKVQAALAGVVLAAKDSTELMRSLGNQQLASSKRNFGKESFGSEKWPPLAKSTQESPWPGSTRRGSGTRRRGARNVLHPTGRHLRRKLRMRSGRSYAKVSCAQWWAFVHNFGATL